MGSGAWHSSNILAPSKAHHLGERVSRWQQRARGRGSRADVLEVKQKHISLAARHMISAMLRVWRSWDPGVMISGRRQC